MLKKLLLVRVANMTPGLVDEWLPFLQGEPLPVTPIAWRDEDGLSHHGYVLGGLKLKDYQALMAWERAHSLSTVLDLEAVDAKGKRTPIEPAAALASVGLQINQSALETEEV